MEVLGKKVFSDAKGGDTFKGVALVKGYTKKQTKTNKDYIEGSLQSGSEIRFNAWASSEALTKLMSENYVNCPCLVTGSFDEFKGNVSATLTDVVAVAGYELSDFLEAKFDCEAYLAALKDLTSKHLSESGKIILSKTLYDNEEVVARFKVEFAAKSNHGNYLSGLLVHTFRMTSILTWLLTTYPNLSFDRFGEKFEYSASRVDLLYIGVVLHDIGKIQEFEYGVYVRNSAITHRILGLDLLYQFRMDIELLFGEKWFRDLQSVIVGHHGEFGDACRTVPAYIVHKVDMLESGIEFLNGKLNGEFVSDASGEKILVDGNYLSV